MERMMAMMASMIQEDKASRRQEREVDHRRYMDAVDGSRQQMELHLHRVESVLSQRPERPTGP